MKKWKKNIVLILVACIVFLQASPLMADESSRDKVDYLKSLSETETIDFLIKNGLIIPKEDPNPYAWASFAKSIVGFVLSNPSETISGINHETSYSFAVSIREIVLKYCGKIPSSANRYSLLFSTKYCSWVSSFGRYNCYAFAIGKTDRRYTPGELSGSSWMAGNSAYTAAVYARQDLLAQGYTNVAIFDIPPTISGNDGVICVRTTSDKRDYHFMRYYPYLGKWRHKPGTSLPIQYKYAPNGYGSWTNEYSKNDVDYPGSIYYSSTIYYIRFTPPS